MRPCRRCARRGRLPGQGPPRAAGPRAHQRDALGRGAPRTGPRASRAARLEQRLRELSAHLQSVVEEERRAIAREIHDEIGGTLTALRFDLGWIARNSEAPVRQRAAQALEALSLAQAGEPAPGARPAPPVLDAGIGAAIDWQLAQFRKRTGAQACCGEHRPRRAGRCGRDDRVPHAAGGADQRGQARRTPARSRSTSWCVTACSRSRSSTTAGTEPADLHKPQSFGLRGLADARAPSALAGGVARGAAARRCCSASGGHRRRRSRLRGAAA